MSDQDRDDRVRQLAYMLWEAAGRPEGEDARFWREAEQQLKAEAPSDELEEGLEESFPASDAPASTIRHEK